MAQTSFTGPVVSQNGFEGAVDTGGEPLVLATPTAAANASNFTATSYVTMVGQNGTTYYIPVRTAAW